MTKVKKTEQAVNNELQMRITELLKQLGTDLYEREEHLAVALLAVLNGQNTFLYGLPGTAKSLISRRLALAFDKPTYFEHLMNRFTTPEEVFGPVSIKELKQDNYIRKTSGYLPEAEFAFLDEIWKSSPAVLNTLLTLINEHTYKNGTKVIKVPLKSLIVASNEVPAENQGLDALYDRFIVRLNIPGIEKEENFNKLINATPITEDIKVPMELKIKEVELSTWKMEIDKVILSDETLQVIKKVRIELSEQYESLKTYVSDRRWQKIAQLLKASAFFNGRKETNYSDVVLLKHCLWSSPETRTEISGIVLNAIENNTSVDWKNLKELGAKKEELDKEINKELYFRKDVYDVVQLSNKEGNYYKVNNKILEKSSPGNSLSRHIMQDKFIACSEIKTKKSFNLVDANGNNAGITGVFDEQGSCQLSYNNRNFNAIFKPTVLFHKGDKNNDINERLLDGLKKAVIEVKSEFEANLALQQDELTKYKKKLYSPFICNDEMNVIVTKMAALEDKLQLRIKDCERLADLCKE